jgi:hypothetical protein
VDDDDANARSTDCRVIGGSAFTPELTIIAFNIDDRLRFWFHIAGARTRAITLKQLMKGTGGRRK